MEIITPQPFAYFELSENERNPQSIFQADVECLASDLEMAVKHLYATGLKLQQAMDQAPELRLPADWHQKLLRDLGSSVDLTRRLPNASSASLDGNLRELNAWQRELQRCI